MEPNYSRHALIQAFCWSITRGVTLAFQSPSVCFEICDNHSRLPFVTACSVWCGGEKSMAHSYGGVSLFPFKQLKTLLPCSPTSLHTNDNNCACVRVPVCVFNVRVWARVGIAWCFGGEVTVGYALHALVNVCC